jgi:hypothetical protein
LGQNGGLRHRCILASAFAGSEPHTVNDRAAALCGAPLPCWRRMQQFQCNGSAVQSERAAPGHERPQVESVKGLVTAAGRPAAICNPAAALWAALQGQDGSPKGMAAFVAAAAASAAASAAARAAAAAAAGAASASCCRPSSPGPVPLQRSGEARHLHLQLPPRVLFAQARRGCRSRRSGQHAVVDLWGIFRSRAELIGGWACKRGVLCLAAGT